LHGIGRDRQRGYAALVKVRVNILIAVIVALAAILLSGCLRISAEDLYYLPQVSEEYLRLQGHLNTIRDQGAEFSPPRSGLHRQAVQLKDLDGDGINEVIAFFSVTADSTLKIYIFEMVDGDYAVAEIIEGVGTAIESVRYVDMDGNGVMEIIVGWQMGDALRYMEIYSIKDLHAVLLWGAEYEEITVYDMTGDGTSDVITVRLPPQGTGAVAEVFTLMPDGELVSTEARLSSNIDLISRVQTGMLVDGVPAIFVESEGRFDEGMLVTDIFIVYEGSLVNISMKGQSGISEETVRNRRIFSSDVNNDGIIKVPMPRQLQAQSETVYHAIDWYSFNSAGASRLALTTYHNYTDEWFLILPLDWRGRVSVRREDVVAGERTVIFSYIEGEDGPYRDFLKVHRITGELREDRARQPGRVMLTSEGMSVFAFELLAPPNSYGLTFDEALIRDNFRLIFSEWLAGTT